jgi:hypothetical protein
VGSTASLGVQANSGLFGSAWNGSQAVVGVSGATGQFTPGSVIWEGNDGSIAVVVNPQTWSATVTWQGSQARIGVAATSALFTFNQTWAGGSEAIISITAPSGEWTTTVGWLALWNGMAVVEMMWNGERVVEWSLVNG